MLFKTTDLYDEHLEKLQVAAPIFRHSADVSFNPGHCLYADEDGIVVADHDLITSTSHHS